MTRFARRAGLVGGLVIVAACGRSRAEEPAPSEIPLEFRSPPPVHLVDVEGRRISLIYAGYCWASDGGEICADTFMGNTIDSGPGQRWEFDFEREPETFEVGDDPTDDVPLPGRVEGATYVAPSEPGSYEFHLSVEWPGGNAFYLLEFRVSVPS